MREHISVFKNEISENLSVVPDGNYADLTLGAGGHALDIWNQLETGTLIVFDLEQEAIANFVESLGEENDPESGMQKFKIGGKTLITANINFERISEVISEYAIGGLDGIIADLGWSSEQLERIPGLSFSKPEEILDMRLGESGPMAADLLNGLGAPQLKQLLADFADIYGGKANRLVEEIIQRRKISSFKQVKDLLEVIDSASDSALHRGSRRGNNRFSGIKQKHTGESSTNLPARVFQAFRIAVNSELSTLQSMLPYAWEALKVGGILEVISFHSGEHNLVEQFCHDRIAELEAENIFSKQYLRPSVDELMQNLAARSAKLWGIKKIR